ncbi:MAG: NPCBM/NEW2 domain-containing protein [Planctomycetes bacterium]|nr:NPCBM/NEW2 domain-containing protein [Planctomycetota bacterium]
MKSRLLPVLALGALAALAAPAAAGPRVEVIAVDRGNLEGTLEASDRPGVLALQTSSGQVSLPLAEIVEVVFGAGDPARQARETLLVLENGDRLCGTLTGGTDPEGGLVFEDGALGRLVFEDLGKIRWILLPGTEAPPLLPVVAKGTDVVFRKGQGAISGAVRSFGRDAVRVDRTDPKITLEIPLAEAEAVYLAPLFPFAPPAGLLAVLSLRNGGVATGTLTAMGAEGAQVDLLAGFRAKVPWESVAAIGFRNGRCVFLSDLDPVRIREEKWLFDPPEVHEPPFEGKAILQFRRDASYVGTPLRIAGRTYLKGIGPHSWTEVEYDLAGAYAAFESRVGIDDAAGPGNGSVIFRVRVDGKEAWASPVMTGGAPPRDVRVACAGARRLSLIVDYAAAKWGTGPADAKPETLDEHVLDRADWALARLVKP